MTGMLLNSALLAPPAPGGIFPDEGCDNAANFDFTNSSNKAAVTGGQMVLSGLIASQFVLLADTPEAAMLAQLSDGVQYDITIDVTVNGAGTVSMSLKGGSLVGFSSGTGLKTITVTAGSSTTEAWRMQGSGNPVSGNCHRTFTSIVVTPH